MKRIVAHTDFDGLVSAIILREMFDIDEIAFNEPWVIQKGEGDIRKGDVIVDLPFDHRCELWIDHHKSNEVDAIKLKKSNPNKVVFNANQPSCPGLLFEHYGEDYPFMKEEKWQEIIAAADKIDSASFTIEDIESPDVWGKISISMRSDDKKKDEEYRRLLINMIGFMEPEEILKQPIVKKRIEEKEKERDAWMEVMPQFASYDEKTRVLIIDRSDAPEDTPSGAPFLTYAKFPGSQVSISISLFSEDPSMCKCSVGKNIFQRGKDEHPADIGELLKQRGGGGHKDVGGCSFPLAEKEQFVKDLIADLEASKSVK